MARDCCSNTSFEAVPIGNWLFRKGNIVLGGSRIEVVRDGVSNVRLSFFVLFSACFPPVPTIRLSFWQLEILDTAQCNPSDSFQRVAVLKGDSIGSGLLL